MQRCIEYVDASIHPRGRSQRGREVTSIPATPVPPADPPPDTTEETRMPIPAAAPGYRTITPFVIATGADRLGEFLRAVFAAEQLPDAWTTDEDGLLLHAEYRLGDSVLALAERKPDWPPTPSLLQVYVEALEATLRAAEDRGASVVTRPTPFFGATLARFVDPTGGLWWVLQQDPVPSGWSGSEAAREETAERGWTDAESWDVDDASLRYVHDSLVSTMRELAPGS